MKKFLSIIAIATFLFSVNGNAQQEPKQKKGKTKTEKSCSTDEKKSCGSGSKKASGCCSSKK
jgi:hypothetical protein